MKKNKKQLIKNSFLAKQLKDEKGIKRKTVINVLCVLLIAISFIGAAKGFGLTKTLNFIASR